MKITAKKEEVLATLRKNRETHGKIVSEARIGYVEKAQKALAARLDELKSGKIVSLSFNLMAPLDYTKEYNTAIRALEMEVNDEIELNGAQIHCFIMDQWDWTNSFFGSNSQYSATARTEATQRAEE